MELIHWRRLLKGIIYLSTMLFFAFEMEMDIIYYKDIFFLDIMPVVTIIYALLGVYFLISYSVDRHSNMELTIAEHIYVWQHSGSKPDARNNNIKETLEYRDSLASTMNNSDRATLYANTGWIDAMAYNSVGNPKVAETMDYVNSTLGTMSNSDRINFLANGR